jgi:hypothetical protein
VRLAKSPCAEIALTGLRCDAPKHHSKTRRLLRTPNRAGYPLPATFQNK